jgi:hypothetical protein
MPLLLEVIIQHVILNIILKINHPLLEKQNSVAVLNEETKEQLNALGEDIFRYFGLGCEMFLNFCTKRLFFRFEAIFAYQDVYT